MNQAHIRNSVIIFSLYLVTLSILNAQKQPHQAAMQAQMQAQYAADLAEAKAHQKQALIRGETPVAAAPIQQPAAQTTPTGQLYEEFYAPGHEQELKQAKQAATKEVKKELKQSKRAEKKAAKQAERQAGRKQKQSQANPTTGQPDSSTTDDAQSADTQSTN